MERTVLDWQGPRIAGFIGGTYVQLSLADWLRLGGNVERAVEENYSEYTYSYSASEEEMEAEKRVALSPLAHRRNQPSTEPEQRVSPTRSSRSPTPLLHSVSHRPS